LEEFLSDFFIVHFIDLPGFHRNSPPFDGKISLEKFSQYLDQEIEKLDVDEYIVGGVSFGFLVVNNAKLDRRCKAILAIEPFINSRSLNASLRKGYAALSLLMKILLFFHIEKTIWKAKWFSEYLHNESNYPQERIEMIINHIDAQTFFSVATLLMSYKKEPLFHTEIPYYLIGNFEDKTVNFDSIVEIFKKSISQLNIISVPIDHYPVDPTKKYFEKKIPAETMHQIIVSLSQKTTD